MAKGVTPSGRRQKAVWAARRGSAGSTQAPLAGWIIQSSRSIWSLRVSMARRTSSTLAKARSWWKPKGLKARGRTVLLIASGKSKARTGSCATGASGWPGEKTAQFGE